MGGEEAGESQGQRKEETKISLTFGLEETFFFFNSLAKIRLTHHKVPPLKVYNSMVFRMFT